MKRLFWMTVLFAWTVQCCPAEKPADAAPIDLAWQRLAPLPDPIGFAGPFVGTQRVDQQHGGDGSQWLLVAGGANFPEPVWETDKRWHDRVFVGFQQDGKLSWIEAGRLPRPVAYGSAVSTADGVLCIGGSDGSETFRDCFLLRWNGEREAVETIAYPPLPKPLAYGAAARIGDTVYVCGGQTDLSLDSAINELWALDLSRVDQPTSFRWRNLPPCPGKTRALNLTVRQHNGQEDCLYVISGRRQNGDRTEFLTDTWEYSPSGRVWRRRGDAPRSVMAGTAIGVGGRHIAVLGGADGRFFGKENELKDKHPGFVKRAIAYDTLADRWVDAGAAPTNQVTTIAVRWHDAIVVASGEIRPRVRTPDVYRVDASAAKQD